MPKLALLDPELTKNLPKSLSLYTGLDAFTHNLEAFLATGFDPMADGLAQEAMRLIIENLPIVLDVDKNYDDDIKIDSRGKMLMASTMGATAFQKGLGMIHSLAHPLSSECGLHHGHANALVGPECISWIENQILGEQQTQKISRVINIFEEFDLNLANLAQTLLSFYQKLGLQFGLNQQGVNFEDLDTIANKALLDVCHLTNICPVNKTDFLGVLNKSMT